MGSSGASDCDAGYRADSRIREVRIAATPVGWDGRCNRIELSGGAAVSTVLSENVFPVWKYRWNASRRSWLSFQFRRYFGCGKSTVRKWLRQPAARVALQQ